MADKENKSYSSISRSNREKREKRRVMKSYVLKIICLIFILLLFSLVLLIGCEIVNAISRSSNNEDTTTVSTEKPTETPTENVSGTAQIVYKNKTYSSDGVKSGPLVLVDGDHEYTGKNSGVKGVNTSESGYTDVRGTTLLDVRSNRPLSIDGTPLYSLVVYTMLLDEETLKSFNNMITDFNKVTGDTRILLKDTFRSRDDQALLYGEGDVVSIASPGHSDYEAGYSVRISYTESGKQYPVADEPMYDWIYDNAYKYGFVVRNPADKSNITGIMNDESHFRYVGYPHAYEMNTLHMCLEEYLDYIKNHTFVGEHLLFPADDGNTYEIYYVPSEGAETSVPVPSDYPYTVSGDNIGGFIVTVNIGVVEG